MKVQVQKKEKMKNDEHMKVHVLKKMSTLKAHKKKKNDDDCHVSK